MKNKKIVYIILACIIVIGMIVIAISGFNVSLKYSPNKQITVYLGKEFKNDDIRYLVREVIGNNNIIVQKVEMYEEIASITVKDITDEQVEQINNKINEKYSLENTVKDNIIVTENTNFRIRDLVKPFIIPIALSLVVILVYAAIRYRKINILEVLSKILGINILAELLFVSLLAIIRIPVNIITIPIALAIYIITTLVVFNDLEEKCKKYVIQEKNNKK